MTGLLPRRALSLLVALLLVVAPGAVALAAQPNPEIDLRITKTDSKDPVQPGEQFQYLIQGANDGPSGALQVWMVDTLPPEVKFVGATVSQGTCSHDGAAAGGTLSCDVGAMLAGDTVDLTITVEVNPGVVGTFVNVVRIENREDPAFAPQETDLTNNEDDEPTTVPPPPEPGSIGDFVWLDLDGEQDQDPTEPGIAGVTVNLDGPGGPQTAVTDANGLYLFTDLAAGVYDVTVDVASAPLAGHTATTATTVNHSLAEGEDYLEADFGFRPPPEREPEIDLELTKDVTPGQVNPGQAATFTITVVNKGPDPATDVEVGDVLPDGLVLQSHDGGTAFDPDTLTWAIGDLAVGATASLQFTVTVTRAGSFTNVAQVTAAAPDDVDSTPNNNVPTEDDQDDATVVAAEIAVLPATTIGDDVFFDDDEDGVRDAAEAGIGGATVTITRVADGKSESTSTNAQGKYLFSSFAGDSFFEAGDYRVAVAVPPLAGTGLTRLTTVAEYVVTVPALAGDESFTDLDNDFGFILALGDLVWFDNDLDGRKDAGEQGIAGVELILQDAAGNELARVKTNANGIYGFRVPPGTYRVTVNTATLPSSVEFLTFPSSNLHTKTLVSADDLSADFGYCGGPAILPCTGLTTGGVGLAGGVLVLIGAGLVLLGRRREVLEPTEH